MRRWGLVPWICCAAAATATAQPAPAVLGHGALPGGLHAPTAETLPGGMIAFAATGGLGWRSGLVGADHRLRRSLGGIGIAFAPTGVLSIALALDGRHDRHAGVDPDGDDSYVGDPRLIARLAKATGRATLGGQVSLWAPGGEAPSIPFEAISVEARGLASIRAGTGTIGVSAGFRLDNSARSVDDPLAFRAHERVSLGVSEHHAVVGSTHLAMPAGRAFVGAEASIELFVGGPAPPGPLLRAGVHGGLHLGGISVLLFAELAKVPAIDAADLMADDFALIAYEPMITGGLALQARFGGGAGAKRPGLASHVKVTPAKPAAVVPVSTTSTPVQGKDPRAEPEPQLPEPSELRAVVSDAVTGQPIAGATVSIEPGGVTATTGAEGTLSVQLAPGTYKATATAPGRGPQTLDVIIDNGVHIKNFELRKRR